MSEFKRIRVRKDRSLTDFPFVWHYTVEHDPPQEDALDYGSMPSQGEALDAAYWALQSEVSNV